MIDSLLDLDPRVKPEDDEERKSILGDIQTVEASVYLALHGTEVRGEGSRAGSYGGGDSGNCPSYCRYFV
jgi:hypothetical protein